MKKFCPKCRVEKELLDFHNNKARNDGKTSYCRDCHEIYYRPKRDLLRKLVLEKLGGCCKNCGYSDARALQVDHINGGGRKERKSVNSPGRYMRLVLEDRLNRYQLLCANCNCIKRIENSEHAPYNKLLSR